LRVFPGSGVERLDLGPGVRTIVKRPYLIVYQKADGLVRILRVLHGAQDIDAIIP